MHKLLFITSKMYLAADEVHRKFDVTSFNSASMRGVLVSKDTGEEVEFWIRSSIETIKSIEADEVQIIGPRPANDVVEVARTRIRRR